MKLLSVVALAFAFAIVSLPCAEARPEKNPEKDDAQDPHQGDHGEPPVTTVASPTTVASNASEPVPTDPPADVVDDPAKGIVSNSDGGVNTTLAPSEDTSTAVPSSSETGETTTTSEPATKAPKRLDLTIPPEDEGKPEDQEEVITTTPASTASPDPHDGPSIKTDQFFRNRYLLRTSKDMKVPSRTEALKISITYPFQRVPKLKQKNITPYF